jgi:hypothetical protein
MTTIKGNEINDVLYGGPSSSGPTIYTNYIYKNGDFDVRNDSDFNKDYNNGDIATIAFKEIGHGVIFEGYRTYTQIMKTEANILKTIGEDTVAAMVAKILKNTKLEMAFV